MFPPQGSSAIGGGQGGAPQAPSATKRRTTQFGSALFYKKGRRRNVGSAGGGAYASSAGDSSNFQPESRLGKIIYAVDCCRTRRRATICSVICATMIAVAIALSIYFTYRKQAPIPTPGGPVNSGNATTAGAGGPGVIIPPNFPTMAPLDGEASPTFPTPPPASIPTAAPVSLGPCDLRCRLDILQVFLRQALQERRLNFPLQDVRTSDSGSIINTPQTQAMMYLVQQDTDPLLNFDIIPRTSPAALSNFFATSNISPQLFRLAVTKFGLATLYYELNSDGVSELSWLTTNSGTNICDWEGITCNIDSSSGITGSSSGFGGTSSISGGTGFGFGTTGTSSTTSSFMGSGNSNSFGSSSLGMTTGTTNTTATGISEYYNNVPEYYSYSNGNTGTGSTDSSSSGSLSTGTTTTDNTTTGSSLPSSYYNSPANGGVFPPPTGGSSSTTAGSTVARTNNDNVLEDADTLLDVVEERYRHRESKYDENDRERERTFLRRGRYLRQSSSSITNKNDIASTNNEESSWMVRVPRGHSDDANNHSMLFKNRGQLLAHQREEERRNRQRQRRAQDDSTGSTTDATSATTVNSQIDPFVISEIRLPQRNLTGSLGVSLNLFGQTLQILDLSRNSIGGSLPSDIFANQYNLRELHLYQNDLTGTLDGSMLGLAPQTLEEIYLDDNKLVGSIPTQLGLLTNLKRIDLFGNNIFDTIPTQIGQLTQLETLWLSDNSMGGTLPTELCQLTSLENLYLDFNFFFGTIPECLPSAIADTAVDIRFNHNLLSGDLSTSPSTISQMSRLRILDLDENDFSGILPESWSNLTTLENLAVASNRLGGSLPESYGNLTELKVFNISRNSFEGGTIPQSYVDNMVNLERLLATNINLNTIPDLSSLANLKSIDFAFNTLQPSSLPQWLTQVSSTLEELRLNNNGWQGPLVDISHVTNLKVLTLQDNSLNGNLPDWIGTSLSNLEVLNVRNNFFSGFLPQSFENLVKLRKLDISGTTNQLFGQIPDQVCASITTRNDSVDIIINCQTLQCPTQQYPNCCTCSDDT